MNDDFVAAATLLIVIFVPVGFLIYLGVRYEKREHRRRLEAMRQRAAALRLGYIEEGDAALLAELDKLVRSTHKKHTGKVYSVMEGERRGIAFQAADYSFHTGGGKTHQHHRQTVVRVKMPSVPEFYLRPEHIFDKIGDWIGWHDIDFSHRPEFSRRYFLRGDDEAAIRALFGDPALSTLERDPDRFCMGGGHGWLLIYRPYKSFVAPEELEIYLDRVLDILAAFRGR